MIDTPSLLITDDNRGFRETLAGFCRQKGFRTWLAADGEEAIQIVRSREIHVVLLDMHMPRLTGLETLQRVRHFQSRLPCILISAGVDEQMLAEARDARVFSVLSKPVRCAQVTETVCSALRKTYNWPNG